MKAPQRLEGAVPEDRSVVQDLALESLTRRVAELEHRLDVMKIIVGLVLTGKLLLIVLFVYFLFGNAFMRGGTAFRSATQPVTLLQR